MNTSVGLVKTAGIPIYITYIILVNTEVYYTVLFLSVAF